MKRLHVAMAAAAVLAFGFGTPTVFTQQGAVPGITPQAGVPMRQWWVNKDTPGQFGKHKLHIKLADLKARHKGRANWTETIIDDQNFQSTYNSGAPGTKITPRMHPDTREFFVIVEGEMQFRVEGQEPFVAKRGSVVNIPRKVTYSAEVIGTAPALWVDANQTNFKTMVPIAEPRPAQTPGHTMTKIGTIFPVGTYTGNNKPHFNLSEAEKDPKFTGQNVVQDDHMWAQAIWGYEKDLPAYNPADKGHFHVGASEWWVIMKGQIRHNIETVGDFTSSEGDVVYVPASTWHATRFAGPGPSCRLAISTYQFTSLFEQAQ
ncbi:MAG TPA: cupin domain-containing protein [Vicinamibacterales bacterium]|nr:cupin domain-containing protein [Vicinamibacterales bacterium]